LLVTFSLLHSCLACRFARILLKIFSTLAAAMAIGATAAALQAAIEALVGWRNATLQFFFARSLLQVNSFKTHCIDPMPHYFH
jgi:hypothetical protein